MWFCHCAPTSIIFPQKSEEAGTRYGDQPPSTPALRSNICISLRFYSTQYGCISLLSLHLQHTTEQTLYYHRINRTLYYYIAGS